MMRGRLTLLGASREDFWKKEKCFSLLERFLDRALWLKPQNDKSLSKSEKHLLEMWMSFLRLTRLSVLVECRFWVLDVFNVLDCSLNLGTFEPPGDRNRNAVPMWLHKGTIIAAMWHIIIGDMMMREKRGRRRRSGLGRQPQTAPLARRIFESTALPSRNNLSAKMNPLAWVSKKINAVSNWHSVTDSVA
jgi:hypothetical protein